MKCLRFLLSIVAGAFFLCVATPASLAQCHQPTTITISYTWPPNNLVAVHEGSVPTVPLTTAMNNWNAGLYSTFDCYPSFALDSGTAGRDIFMSYAPLPPPPQCRPGFICFTRGVTDLQNAKFLSGRLSSVNITINSAVNANDVVMKPDIPANRLLAGLEVRLQDFQNLSPLIFLRVGSVNHRICVRDHFDHVLTIRTANPDPGMTRKGFELLEVESE